MKTMRVKFRTSIAAEAWSYGAGDVAELDARQAAAFVKSGTAEPTTEPVGARIYGVCDHCGGQLDLDDQCWSAICRGQWRARAGKGPA